MNSWAGNRVLFVGAHADDVELGCGGWIHQLCRRNSTHVRVLTFSLHRPHYDVEVLRQEVKRSMTVLGVTAHDVHDFQGCSPDNEFSVQRHELYAILEAARDEWRPTLVVTHPAADTNQDHRQVHEEVIRCFKKHASIINYEFPNNMVRGERPDLYVELEGVDVEKKIEALLCYQSQRNRITHNYLAPQYIQALSKVHGQAIMAEAAEAFYVMRLAFHKEEWF